MTDRRSKKRPLDNEEKDQDANKNRGKKAAKEKRREQNGNSKNDQDLDSKHEEDENNNDDNNDNGDNDNNNDDGKEEATDQQVIERRTQIFTSITTTSTSSSNSNNNNSILDPSPTNVAGLSDEELSRAKANMHALEEQSNHSTRSGLFKPSLVHPSTPATSSSSSFSSSSSSSSDNNSLKYQSTTPTRQTRQEEKIELQELNKRLEFYILRQRERDASQGGVQREVDMMREKTDSDLRHAKMLFEAQIEEVRKSRDSMHEQLTKLVEEKAKTDNHCQLQAHELEALKKFRITFEEKNKNLAHELQQTQAKLFVVEDDSKRFEHSYNLEKEKSETLRKELDKQRERADRLASDLALADSKSKTYYEDLQLERTRSSEEIRRYELLVAKLSHENSRNEQDIRKEFHIQMNEALVERQSQYEAEKDEGLRALRQLYDDKIRAFREELENVGHLLEEEKSRNKSLKSDLHRLEVESHDFTSTRQVLATRIAELEEAIRQERAKPNKILAERNEIIRRIKAAFKRKDEEFDELMDIKIALAMELKAYRTMLETEEDRLGYKSPLKVRRVSTTPSIVAPSPRTMTTTTTTTVNVESKAEIVREEPPRSLLISGTDLEGQYIRIRNGGTESVPLAGWSLRSKRKGSEFKFSDNVRLRPGETYTVRTLHADNEEAKRKTERDSNSIGTVAWSKPDVWDETGDEAQLIDPNNEVIAHVDILPTFKSSEEQSSSHSTSTFSSFSESSEITSIDIDNYPPERDENTQQEEQQETQQSREGEGEQQQQQQQQQQDQGLSEGEQRRDGEDVPMQMHEGQTDATPQPAANENKCLIM